MTLSVNDVLGPEGLIARRLGGYEQRPQQLEMAGAISRAIADRRHVLVEAGTGVGKSFAYLVPAILSAVDEPESTARREPEGDDETPVRRGAPGGLGAAGGRESPRRRKSLLISTHTISLQEQLIGKDLPFLNAVLPVEFSAVLAKGRSNYISLRRLKGAAERAGSMFPEREEVQQLQRLRTWSRDTRDGSLADLEFKPLPSVWDEVRSEHGNCLGRKCPTYDSCWYFKARRRLFNADLVVVNHALFFADLALRREGASVLPDYDVVIFDEAHTIEDVAGDHLGLSLTTGQFTFLFNKLYNDRQGKGLLVHHGLNEAQQLVQRLRWLTDGLFRDLAEWRDASNQGRARVQAPAPLENVVSPELRMLSATLREFAGGLQDPAEQIELTASADRLELLAGGLQTWLQQSFEDGVYWMESTGGRAPGARLICAPVEVGPVLRDELFNKTGSVVLTSATLSVGGRSFQYIRERLGLTQCTEVQLGSPFNFRKQVRLVLSEDMPDPGERPAEYEDAVCERIRRHVQETGGRAFVLFTSFRMLKSCAAKLTPWFTRQNLKLLVHGDGEQRSALLEKFRADGRAVLFGADSFWQGVDVPGDALQNVIITKLSFSVPDHPLLEARVERIKSRGGNPFLEYQTPEAAIRLKQGFGRLIRTATDKGQVVILDPRIRTKRYGKLFLDSLPPCDVVLDNGQD